MVERESYFRRKCPKRKWRVIHDLQWTNFRFIARDRDSCSPQICMSGTRRHSPHGQKNSKIQTGSHQSRICLVINGLLSTSKGRLVASSNSPVLQQVCDVLVYEFVFDHVCRGTKCMEQRNGKIFTIRIGGGWFAEPVEDRKSRHQNTKCFMQIDSCWLSSSASRMMRESKLGSFGSPRGRPTSCTA